MLGKMGREILVNHFTCKGFLFFLSRKWKADSCALSVNKSGLLDKRLLEVLERNLRFEIGHLMLRKWGLIVNNVMLLV
jgi:hypothetical protein